MITDIRISSTDVVLTQDSCFNQSVEIDYSGMEALNYQPHEYHIETGPEVSPGALSPSYPFMAKIEIDDGTGGTIELLKEIWVNFISDID